MPLPPPNYPERGRKFSSRPCPARSWCVCWGAEVGWGGGSVTAGHTSPSSAHLQRDWHPVTKGRSRRRQNKYVRCVPFPSPVYLVEMQIWCPEQPEGRRLLLPTQGILQLSHLILTTPPLVKYPRWQWRLREGR